jgi:hypothetical protein
MLTRKLNYSLKKNRNFSTSFSSRGKALVVAEHENSRLSAGTLNTITAASKFGEVDVLVVGNNCDEVANSVSWLNGVKTVYVNSDASLTNPSAEALTAVCSILDHLYIHCVFRSCLPLALTPFTYIIILF